MKFYIPTKVFREKDCVLNHGGDIAGFGAKALIVTGRHSAKASGALDDVLTVLKDKQIDFAIFDQIEENPSRETIMKGRDFGRLEEADFIIAIGGGSALDAGKAISLMMAQPEEGIDYLYSKQENFNVLPIVAIPTTCGTGSEVTGVSVLTNLEKGTKGSIPFKIFPDLALLDAKYLNSLGNDKICDTAVDALAHLMESYLCASATDFSRLFVKEGLAAFSKNIPALTGEKAIEIEDLDNLLYTSTIAGMAIAHTGTTIPHAMSYPATFSEKVSHGRACGYYLTGYLKETGEVGQVLLPKMAGFKDLDQLTAFVADVCHMNDDEITPELRLKTAQSMAQNTAKLATSSVTMDLEKLLRIARV